MNPNPILLTTGWTWWCKKVGNDWICKSGNLISSEEEQSRHLTTPEPGYIVRTIIRRLVGLNKSKPAISAVFGEPDFLPFRFLELGLRSGAAVCRLGRRFSQESAEDFVNKIYEESEKHPDFSLTASTLTEILSLNDSQKEDFFGKIEDNVLESLDRNNFANKLAKLRFVPAATAFLVGRKYLLTNYHVFPEQLLTNLQSSSELETNVLNEYVAQFNYEQDIIGRQIVPVEYGLESLIAANKNLDYALVALKERPERSNSYSDYIGVAGDQFGWIPMQEDPMIIAPNLEKHNISEDNIKNELLYLQKNESDLLNRFIQNSNTVKIRDTNTQFLDMDLEKVKKILRERARFGEPVNIIQHPKGRHKEIVVSNNWTIQLFDNYLWYEADADFSSSGSPVFNQQWQLVALHHGAIPPTESENGKHEGVRICKIVEDLRSQLDELVQNASFRDEDNLLAATIWRFLIEFVVLDPDKDEPELPPGYEKERPTPKKPPIQTQAY